MKKRWRHRSRPSRSNTFSPGASPRHQRYRPQQATRWQPRSALTKSFQHSRARHIPHSCKLPLINCLWTENPGYMAALYAAGRVGLVSTATPHHLSAQGISDVIDGKTLPFAILLDPETAREKSSFRWSRIPGHANETTPRMNHALELVEPLVGSPGRTKRSNANNSGRDGEGI